MQRIEAKGILDRVTARSLIQKVSEHPPGVLGIDCSGLYPVLSEGIDALLEGCEQLLSEKSLRLELVSLPHSLVTQLMLRDLPVHNRALTIGEGLAVGDTDAVVCQNCSALLRVQGRGYYGCPECGIHLYTDGRGHVSFYEPLARLK
ncbi:MAG: hypothetical protein HS115_20335 [Spirochaetales bacterium]|nr:hypothetical protein [Spirochaetales bacterium]